MRRRVIVILIAAVCLLILGLGVTNALLIRHVPITLEQPNSEIIIAQITDSGGSEAMRPHRGDILRSINSRQVSSLAEARWLLDHSGSGKRVEVSVDRGGERFSLNLDFETRVSPFHVLAVVLSGLLFFIIGVFVWNAGPRDGILSAFLRLNLCTGTAVLLDSSRSFFEPGFLDRAFTLLWFTIYALIPPTCLDFVTRFTGRLAGHRMLKIVTIYTPPLALTGVVAFILLRSGVVPSTVEILWLDRVMRVGHGISLLIYFSLSLYFLIASWIGAPDIRHRRNSRWLVICTLLSVAPFVLLHKFPTMFGYPAIMSLDLATVCLIAAPIGWGMAVASFRLLPIETTLSRTFIYATSIAAAVFAVVVLLSVSIAHLENFLISAVILVVIAMFILVLAGSTLVRGVRTIVDHVYFGDWFSYRAELAHFAKCLGGAITREEITSILTSELPKLLQIERSCLWARNKQGGWSVLEAEPTCAGGAESCRNKETEALLERFGSGAITENSQSFDIPGSKDYCIALPLIHAHTLQGYLLLGPKESHASYSIRDREFLEPLSPMAGLALANLELVSDLLDRERRATAAELAGGIAHEIRNALYPLKGQAQILERKLENDSVLSGRNDLRDSLAVVSLMSDKIQRIADGLNHLSAPRKPVILPLSLNTVADETINLLEETAGRIKRFNSQNPVAALRLIRDFARDLPMVMADRDLIGQVFVNLIINAADSMQGMKSGTLTVGTRWNPEERVIVGYVADSGIGIPEDKLDAVIRPYYTTKADGQGSGMGLSIVRSIIDNHYGSLRIHSEIGKGTLVEFDIPVAPS